ncbi:MAG: hypothetical protein NT103_01120, partial [Campylobacterales bacterium]|nr:hypothetical protein [Campylobacterales bacterium]
KHPLDRHSCLVFNDLKLKSVRLLKAFQCLWTGIIGDFVWNVKSVLKELAASCKIVGFCNIL